MTDAEVLSNLKSLRKERGLTQRALAQNASCSEVMILRYENQHAQPSTRTMTRLRAALGVIAKERSGDDGVSRSIRHSFHLRSNVSVFFDLPEDLTRSEADRLAGFIRSLPFQEKVRDPG